MATGQDQERKNKVEKSPQQGKARVAVGCGKGAGLPGASLGMFSKGAAKPWKLFLRGEKVSISRGGRPGTQSQPTGAEGGGDLTGRRRVRKGRRLIPG